MSLEIATRPVRPILAAVIAFLLAATASAALIWRFERDRVGLERARASDQADDHARDLQTHIDHAMTATVALAALVREGNGDIRHFDRAARELMMGYPGVSALQLVPGGVIAKIYPLAGNEPAIGLDVFKNAASSREAFLARESGKLALAGPFALAQGGMGVIGRLPVFLGDEAGNPAFWGFTAVLLRLPEALQPAQLETMSNLGYRYKLWQVDPGTGKREVIVESAADALQEPVEATVTVANSKWILGVAPAKGWGDPGGLAARIAMAMVVSLLLALVTMLVLDLQGHRARLESLVARRTTEVAAREADLNLAQSIALVGSWVWDSDGNEIRWSRQAQRMIVRAGEKLPRDFAQFLHHVHPEDRDAMRGTWRAALAGSNLDIEHRVVVGEETRWIRQRAAPEFAKDGKISRLAGTFQEITERKRAQQELAAAEARYRGLVEQSLAGIYVLQDGRFAYVNPRFAEILGYDSPEELMAVDPLATAPESDRDKVREYRRLVLEGEARSVNYHRTAIRKDGTTIELGVTGSLATHEGRPAVVGMAQDISEKKRAEEQISRYVEQLKTAFMHTVEVATTLGEMRDPYTAGHQRRVAEIAVALGEQMGLDPRRVEGLRVAGYLHDIGKITIPAEILAKPGRLSAIEYSLVQAHAQSSHDVLKNVEFPWPVAQVALQHHERMDGSGYPQGLKGEAILLEARILAVADVIEAMSTHRPYRASLGIGAALAEIERGRGTLYDANVAGACLSLFREKGYAIPG